MPRSTISTSTAGSQRGTRHRRSLGCINIPEGTVLEDVCGHKWMLGSLDHVDDDEAFYLASDYYSLLLDYKYMIKMADHSNGSLFTEIQCYQRIGKKDLVNEWIQKKRLNYLGIPEFYGCGSHLHENIKYRFLVMPYYSTKLQQLLEEHGTFPMKTVFTLGIQILDALEYLHSLEYVLVDINASNLYLGSEAYNEHMVHLVNYGLACRYSVDGRHKTFEQGSRKAHCGTVSFASRDSHMGAAHSRRSDLEILGYNMLKWLSGSLPWEDKINDVEYVSRKKIELMSNIKILMGKCFPRKNFPDGMADYMNYVVQLKFDENPDYTMCRNILKTSILRAGYRMDGRLNFNTGETSQMASSFNLKSSTEGPLYRHQASGGIQESLLCTSKSPRKKNRLDTPSTSYSVTEEVEEPLLTEMLSTSLDNPTPAMLTVLRNKWEKAKQQKLRASSPKRRKQKKEVPKGKRKKV